MAMARIIYAMLAALEVASPDRRGGPTVPIPERASRRHVNEIMKRTSMALYGCRMYEVMRIWKSWDDTPGGAEVEVDFARAWRNTAEDRPSAPQCAGGQR